MIYTRHFFVFGAIVAIAATLGTVAASLGDRQKAAEFAVADIPPGATDVVPLGNNWRTFVLETRRPDGATRRRQFLHHFIVNHHASGRAIVSTIVELREPTT